MLAQFYTAIMESILTSSILPSSILTSSILTSSILTSSILPSSIMVLCWCHRRRLQSIRTRTSRYTNSFFPSAIRLLNTK
ncbi:hypothetical protein D4764_0211180 [Takifugu flavidus]|uniref:Uncharacterized protein n=1 Tax=Takifugu flavidus TaxID=433684 RepID=A0A5C6MGE0_9TELE|nr:hypothetical protein D4764_0211180 [Takifugu flavidus]